LEATFAPSALGLGLENQKAIALQILFAQGQLIAGIEPLLKNDFAVFGFRDVHGAGALFEFVRHFLAHVDADSFGSFANRIRSHKVLLSDYSGFYVDFYGETVRRG
jgi:hypothetical protein